ncbi:alpha/beta hydrolase [Leptospira perolatii]|uniref:Alpha/beta hydrolase n=1 Tax=Leptospira perolatii TaxID=2023191 RepID=A0A2M9ZPY8_9LEPT|nr:alpha/beta hydrolase [Leptospira perolatii]PJZ69027.1 alpha/beta hydrolase [Leptospira perolatii]PJZ74104.1 alpha/beta hydrolase [Leptospira perolatii]
MNLYTLKGIPFLLKYADIIQLPSPKPELIGLSLDIGLELKTKVFHQGSDAPVIYVQHGMSAWGIEDLRILALCKHLYNSGFTVYLPELPEVKALTITYDTILRIRSAFKSICKIEESSISYFSASFSAGMGMVALSQPEEQNWLNATFLVGTYSDFGKTLPFVIENFERDEYAVSVLLFNYIQTIIPSTHRLREYFFETALDDGLRRTEDEKKGSKIYSDLESKEREFIEKIRSDSNYRVEIAQKIISSLPEGFIFRSSPANFLQNWRTPIAFLHGSDDSVISPKESESLYFALNTEKFSVRSMYLPSKLITHGDHLPYYTQLPEVLPLARIWGFFLKKANRRKSLC